MFLIWEVSGSNIGPMANSTDCHLSLFFNSLQGKAGIELPYSLELTIVIISRDIIWANVVQENYVRN